MACVYHGLAACQRHTPSSLAAVIGLSNNDIISLRSLRCVGWNPRYSRVHFHSIKAVNPHIQAVNPPHQGLTKEHFFHKFTNVSLFTFYLVVLPFQTQNFHISQILPSVDIWHLFGLISRIPGLLYGFFLF